jgi:tetratricopeptide (TPR) repeat protein
MNRIFPILIVFCMIFVSCATAPEQKAEEIPQQAAPSHVESEYGIRVTPKSVEIYEVSKVADEDLDKLFAEANRLFDENKLDEAERLYTRIAETAPEYTLAPSCRYNAGLIEIKLKNWEAAEKNFFRAYETMQKPEDRRDALLNWLEAARNTGIWEKISEISGKIIGSFPAHSEFKESDRREISLRYAESLIMTGNVEEGRRLADYWRMTILRETPRHEAVYIPELALAYFVLGRSFVKEFKDLDLGDSTESLEEKCKKIVEAQTQFLKAINVGVIFWTNASAFEAAKLYTDLYAEMEARPAPEELTDEEKSVYTCELWKKISILLKKSRKTLVKSTEAAKKIGEENEYTEKSFEMVEEIDRIYEEKENICGN